LRASWCSVASFLWLIGSSWGSVSSFFWLIESFLILGCLIRLAHWVFMRFFSFFVTWFCPIFKK
jgi:hypothetical protein